MTHTALQPISHSFAAALLRCERVATGAEKKLNRYNYKPSKGFRLTITARFRDSAVPTNDYKAHLNRHLSDRQARPDISQ